MNVSMVFDNYITTEKLYNLKIIIIEFYKKKKKTSTICILKKFNNLQNRNNLNAKCVDNCNPN